MTAIVARNVWLGLVILNAVLLGVMQTKFWKLVDASPLKNPSTFRIAHLYATTAFGLVYALISCLFYMVYYPSPWFGSMTRHGIALLLPLIFVGLEIQLLWRVPQKIVQQKAASQISDSNRST